MKNHLLKLTIFIVLAMFLSLSCEESKEAPEYEFKIFGGSCSDWGKSVQQTADGGYIIAGATCSYGEGLNDAWLIKTNGAGDTVWTKTFGGSKNDEGESVQQTTDGGYIIAGFTSSFGAGAYDVWLIKTDTSGDTVWTKTFGGGSRDQGFSVQQTTDGGYIIAGNTASYGAGAVDVWLIKTNASGDMIWDKTFGGSENDEGFSVQQTSDGGYIIAGCTGYSMDTYYDVFVIKTDASGDSAWTRAFGGSDNDWGLNIQQTADGGYIIAGWTTTDEGIFNDVLLIKTDASGDSLWTKIFGDGNHDEGYSVQQTSDGGYIIAGGTASYGAGYWDVWLIKTDTSGDMIWDKTFGDIWTEKGYSIQPTSDGGYIITGYYDSYEGDWEDVLLMKTDVDGNVESFE